MKCERCKNIELKLSHALNELSSVRLIVDLFSKEQNRVQGEMPSDTNTKNNGPRYHITYSGRLTIGRT